MAISGYNGLKVFSATMSKDRDQLGERLTAWLKNNAGLRIVSTVVTQSSDQAFHCISLIVFFEQST